MKVCIAGVGKVGAAVMRNVAEELLLLNRTAGTAEGEALDLSHAGPCPTLHRRSAPATPKIPGLRHHRAECFSSPSSRFDVAAGDGAKQLRSTRRARSSAARRGPRGHLDRCDQPGRRDGHPLVEPRRVLGAGTLIDSARYRSLLSKEVEIHPDDVRAYILGEHGDSQFPALSLAQSGGEWVGSGEAAMRLFQDARGLGYEVLRRKGHTNYTIALAVGVLMESVREDARRTFPVSTPVDGFLGVDDVVISIPAVMGRAGIVRQLHPTLDLEEEATFRASAQVVRGSYRQALD